MIQDNSLYIYIFWQEHKNTVNHETADMVME